MVELAKFHFLSFSVSLAGGNVSDTRPLVMNIIPREKSLQYVSSSEEVTTALDVRSIDKIQPTSSHAQFVVSMKNGKKYLHRMTSGVDVTSLVVLLRRFVEGIPAGSIQSQTPIKDGLCKKKGKLRKQERYLVLVKGRLLVLRSKQSKYPHQVISLTDSSVSATGPKKLAINSGNEKFEYEFSNKDDKSAWQAALAEASRDANGRDPADASFYLPLRRSMTSGLGGKGRSMADRSMENHRRNLSKYANGGGVPEEKEPPTPNGLDASTLHMYIEGDPKSIGYIEIEGTGARLKDLRDVIHQLNRAPKDYVFLERDEMTIIDVNSEADRSAQDFAPKLIIRDLEAHQRPRMSISPSARHLPGLDQAQAAPPSPAGPTPMTSPNGDQILEVRIEGDAESLGVVEIAPEDIDKATLADVRVVSRELPNIPEHFIFMTSGSGGSPIAVRDEMNFYAKDFTPVIVLRRVSASYEGLNELADDAAGAEEQLQVLSIFIEGLSEQSVGAIEISGDGATLADIREICDQLPDVEGSFAFLRKDGSPVPITEEASVQALDVLPQLVIRLDNGPGGDGGSGGDALLDLQVVGNVESSGAVQIDGDQATLSDIREICSQLEDVDEPFRFIRDNKCVVKTTEPSIPALDCLPKLWIRLGDSEQDPTTPMPESNASEQQQQQPPPPQQQPPQQQQLQQMQPPQQNPYDDALLQSQTEQQPIPPQQQQLQSVQQPPPQQPPPPQQQQPTPPQQQPPQQQQQQEQPTPATAPEEDEDVKSLSIRVEGADEPAASVDISDEEATLADIREVFCDQLSDIPKDFVFVHNDKEIELRDEDNVRAASCLPEILLRDASKATPPPVAAAAQAQPQVQMQSQTSEPSRSSSAVRPLDDRPPTMPDSDSESQDHAPPPRPQQTQQPQPPQPQQKVEEPAAPPADPDEVPQLSIYVEGQTEAAGAIEIDEESQDAPLAEIREAIGELELPRNYAFVLKGDVIKVADEERIFARTCLPTLFVRDLDKNPLPQHSPSASRTNLEQLKPQATTEKLSAGSEPNFVTPSTANKNTGPSALDAPQQRSRFGGGSVATEGSSVGGSVSHAPMSQQPATRNTSVSTSRSSIESVPLAEKNIKNDAKRASVSYSMSRASQLSSATKQTVSRTGPPQETAPPPETDPNLMIFVEGNSESIGDIALEGDDGQSATLEDIRGVCDQFPSMPEQFIFVREGGIPIGQKQEKNLLAIDFLPKLTIRDVRNATMSPPGPAQPVQPQQVQQDGALPPPSTSPAGPTGRQQQEGAPPIHIPLATPEQKVEVSTQGPSHTMPTPPTGGQAPQFTPVTTQSVYPQLPPAGQQPQPVTTQGAYPQLPPAGQQPQPVVVPTQQPQQQQQPAPQFTAPVSVQTPVAVQTQQPQAVPQFSPAPQQPQAAPQFSPAPTHQGAYAPQSQAAPQFSQAPQAVHTPVAVQPAYTPQPQAAPQFQPAPVHTPVAVQPQLQQPQQPPMQPQQPPMQPQQPPMQPAATAAGPAFDATNSAPVDVMYQDQKVGMIGMDLTGNNGETLADLRGRINGLNVGVLAANPYSFVVQSKIVRNKQEEHITASAAIDYEGPPGGRLLLIPEPLSHRVRITADNKPKILMICYEWRGNKPMGVVDLGQLGAVGASVADVRNIVNTQLKGAPRNFVFVHNGQAIPFESEKLIMAVDKLPRIYLRDVDKPEPAHPSIRVNNPPPVQVIQQATPVTYQPAPQTNYQPIPSYGQQQQPAVTPTIHHQPMVAPLQQQPDSRNRHISIAQHLLNIYVEGQSGTVSSADLSGAAARATLADIRRSITGANRVPANFAFVQNGIPINAQSEAALKAQDFMPSVYLRDMQVAPVAAPGQQMTLALMVDGRNLGGMQVAADGSDGYSLADIRKVAANIPQMPQDFQFLVANRAVHRFQEASHPARNCYPHIVIRSVQQVPIATGQPQSSLPMFIPPS